MEKMNDNPTYCIWMMEHDAGGHGFEWKTIWAHEYDFRPIRTKEQKERENVINQAHEVVKAAGTKSAFKALYDAGMLVMGNKQ